MAVMIGTNDGVWKCKGDQVHRAGLVGKDVSHVATRDGTILATIPYEGLYAITLAGEGLVWQGDARACAIGPDGTFYVGTEPAMIFRSHDAGETWKRSDAIDTLPTRADWYFPPSPHEPHVRSIDFLPGHAERVLVGIEVGGVLLSSDGGDQWQELNRGIYVDVHAVRPDPSQPDLLVAVTGRGFYASEDGGASWEKRMQGIGHRYTVGLHVNPTCAGEVLVTAGDGPPGVHASIYHSQDAGQHWTEVLAPGLPGTYDRVPVVFFADGAAWTATHTGQLFRTVDVQGAWSPVAELPATIHAVAAAGSPISIDSGYRR